jgi:hypothetical protein
MAVTNFTTGIGANKLPTGVAILTTTPQPSIVTNGKLIYYDISMACIVTAYAGTSNATVIP